MATPAGYQGEGTDSKTRRFLIAAEFFLRHENFVDCQKNALRAQALDPIHPAPPQILAIAAVISASSSPTATSRQRPDYYSILSVPRYTADTQLIRTRAENLTALLNPRENHYAWSEQAYRLVTEAWNVLSVPANRAAFDEELKMSQKSGSGSETQSFWTMCPYCYYVYEYPTVYKECCLRCQNEKCRRAFSGVAIQPPPPEVVALGKFSCPGFMPIPVEAGGGNGLDSWTPFAESWSRNVDEYNGNGLTGNGCKQTFSNQAFTENENGVEGFKNGVNMFAKAHNVGITGRSRDKKMESRHGSDQRMDNGRMMLQKIAATSTNKVMGKGVRIEALNTVPLEGNVERKPNSEGSGYNYNGLESELISGNLVFFEEEDDIFVDFLHGF